MLRREPLSEHLVRLVLGDVTGLDAFASTGVLDEWVGLVVPGQFQSRYYTVRSWDGVELVLDVVVHEEGLVTEWASRDCVGDAVTISEPKGSFAMPDDAGWLLLVGDLTAMPASHTKPTRPMTKAAYAAIRTRRQSAPLRVAGAEAEGTRGCYVQAGNSLGR